MIENLIYDFDGTLSDTYPVVTKVFLGILKEQGISATYQEVYDLLKVSYGHALKHYGLYTPEFRALLDQRCAAAAMVDQKPFAEALELLRSAALTGKRNFIYTHSGKFVHDVIEKWGFTPYVTYTLDFSHGFPRKPDPTALHFLCEKFDIDVSTALMVGDRDIDIEVGHNAGMKGCLFDPEGYYSDCKAEFRVNCLSDIIKLLDEVEL